MLRLTTYIAVLALMVACDQSSGADPSSVVQDTIEESQTAASLDIIESPTPYHPKFDYDTSQWLDLRDLDPSLGFDLRYATENNFVGEKMYPCGRCLLRPAVAHAIVSVHRALKTRGLGLLLLDCYRPQSVQYKLWKKVPDPRYVANPDKGSAHNRGGAVDLTLMDAYGRELDMGTPYDFFGEEAYTTYTKHPDSINQRRNLLYDVMEGNGFKRIRTEWWHFSWTKKTYPLSDDAWLCDVE